MKEGKGGRGREHLPQGALKEGIFWGQKERGEGSFY